MIFTFVSFVLSNFGLNSILTFSVPILVSIYPVAIVLVVLALLHDFMKLDNLTYKLTAYVTLFISILQGLKVANINIVFLNNVMSKLPLYAEGLEWVIPAFVVLIVTNTVLKIKEKGVTYGELSRQEND